MSVPRVNGSEAQAPSASPVALLAIIVVLALAPLGVAQALEPSVPDHLVISEVVTGGTSASDELIEIYNPTAVALPVEGLELVYVSASGLTVSRRAAWELGAPPIDPGSHLLVANEAGVYAPIADAVYASGMAATGGSVALRVLGAGSAIDGVGWGTAAGTWLEGAAALVAAAGSSIERLPGGAMGSTQDTDDNATDFVERLVPDPENTTSPPVPQPGATPTPTPVPTLEPTPIPTPAPTAGPGSTTIVSARAAADGTEVTIEGVTLTGSAFHDGGGYVADATAGIAVIVEGGAFSAGARLRVTGTVEDRFAQRTIRASGSGLVDLGVAADPPPQLVATGAVGEAVEGSLVRLVGAVDGAPTMLTSGLAFDVDDGSGVARVLVGSATGIDATGWVDGATVDVAGVVGQRDSSGTGVAGYRVQPRAASDVLSVAAPTASPAPSLEATPSPDASAPPAGVVSIAEARAAAKNARVVVRGVVTLGSGIVDEATAVLQDATGAIMLRLGDEAGAVAVGESLEVGGVRSTKSGMETLRVTAAPLRLGTTTLPSTRAIRTADAGEALEAILVSVRGALVAAPRRTSSGTLSFEVDDGSGPLRIVVGGSLGLGVDGLGAGSWLDVRGVLGQETSGSQPLRGYRIWPASAADVRIVAAAVDADERRGPAGTEAGARADSRHSLASIGAADLSGLTIGATLVAGPWAELELGGLLWDGQRLVGLDAAAADSIPDAAAARPTRLELRGLRRAGVRGPLDLEIVALGGGPGDLAIGDGTPHAPSTAAPSGSDAPVWLSRVGELRVDGAEAILAAGDATLRIERRCSRSSAMPDGAAHVVGIGLADPPRLVVGCGGITPVSRLERPTHASGAGSAPAAPSAATAIPAAAQAPTRLLASALLAGGMLVLVAAAAVNRRPGADPDDATAASEPRPEAPEADAPPRLTLVTLPRERGSP